MHAAQTGALPRLWIWAHAALRRLWPLLHTTPVMIMMAFLAATFLFALYCRCIWRFRKPFMEP